MLTARRARFRLTRTGDQGFMLVELMVVVAILSAVTGISVPIFASLKDDSYDAAAAADLRTWVTQMEGARFSFGDTFGPDVPVPAASTGPLADHEKSHQVVGLIPGLPDFGTYYGYVWDDRTNHVFCYSSVQGIVHLIDDSPDLEANQAACTL